MLKTLRPDRTVGERIYTSHLTNLTIPDPLTYEVDTLTACTLVTHLSSNISLGSQLCQQTRLIYGTCKRLLAINSLAGHQSLCTDDCMCVVSCTADNAVALVEQFCVHLLIVVIHLTVGEQLGVFIDYSLGILLVHISQSDELDVIINLLAVVGYAVEV